MATTLERHENESEGIAAEVFEVSSGLRIRLIDIDSGMTLPIMYHFPSDRFSLSEVSKKAEALATGRRDWRAE